jgi:hypothetical protein
VLPFPCWSRSILALIPLSFGNQAVRACFGNPCPKPFHLDWVLVHQSCHSTPSLWWLPSIRRTNSEPLGASIAAGSSWWMEATLTQCHIPHTSLSSTMKRQASVKWPMCWFMQMTSDMHSSIEQQTLHISKTTHSWMNSELPGTSLTFCLTTNCCSTHPLPSNSTQCSCLAAPPLHLEAPACHSQAAVGSFPNSPCAIFSLCPMPSCPKGIPFFQTEHL